MVAIGKNFELNRNWHANCSKSQVFVQKNKTKKNPQNLWNSVFHRIRGTWFLLFEFFTILSGNINFCKKWFMDKKYGFGTVCNWNSTLKKKGDHCKARNENCNACSRLCFSKLQSQLLRLSRDSVFRWLSLKAISEIFEQFSRNCRRCSSSAFELNLDQKKKMIWRKHARLENWELFLLSSDALLSS